MGGTITNVTIVPGMTLANGTSDTTETSGQRVAVINSPGSTLATVNLSEIDVSHVKQGQKVTITADAIKDKTFTGSVVSVDQIGTVSGGVTSYPAILALDTEAKELLPHMAVNAAIILETKTDILLVPLAAVSTQDGQGFVMSLRNGQEIQLLVETGLTSDTQIEITSGLSEGDEIITGTISTTLPNSGTSVFGGFGGGALRSGNFGGGNIRTQR
ncbi:MAG: efflux RND transporter periplasmic adaptor subunit [Patescibacteria group bacterium]